METMIELACEACGTKFKRRAGEVNRNKKKGLRVYCNNRCQGLKSDNLERIKQYQWTTENHPRGHISKKDEFSDFRWYMKNIKQRNQVCDFDLDYLKDLWNNQKGICPLTGWELILKTHICYRRNIKDIPLQIYHASLDRIDSTKGYIKGNVRFVSVIANYAKHKWNDEELIEFCKAVADNN